jgi:hypothetical protein
MKDVLYVAVLLIRFPIFLIGITLWTALTLLIAPLYFGCVLLLLPVKLIESSVKHQSVIFENFLADVKKDMARVKSDYQEILAWLTGG